MRTITVSVEFKIGTLEEIGLGGLKQEWMSSTDSAGREFSLTCGAGLGNSLLEASAKEVSGRTVYARGSGADIGQQLFAALAVELDN